ncbi:MAG: asparagine synthase (glutamine-hydrolyzing) [Thiohalomonadales bacterium]|nr:asparagine synthase (glutamine-hydrolyzing) [Thiohalomonadales bacterium]
MCGIGGVFQPASEQAPGEAILRRMGQVMRHRGPDQDGVWTAPGLGLIHRRLSIQDISPAGAQPMTSASGRYVIAFNGEIYNFLSLREKLAGAGKIFRGHSDTEVMLAAFEYWGVDASLERFSGMFAFALVDREAQQLVLARDRMGEKPLYYGWQNGILLFGSELKALRAHPAWHGEIDRNALTLLLRHNFIPAPHTIYRNIRKLLPATMVRFDLNAEAREAWPEPQQYWFLEAAFDPGRNWSFTAAADELENRLSSVIGQQMVSDVPLGAFLSGGIDSSTVVALMQKQSSRPVKTFSIGFKEAGFNEAEHAKAVAAHLKTDHTELYVSPDESLELIPDLPGMYDEPFADSSQIPTHLVSRMTRQHVTVALSGDGGDEMFCGYTRYPGTVAAWDRRGHWRERLRQWAALFPPEAMARLIRRLVPGQGDRAVISLVERLRQEAATARAATLPAFYREKVSFWSAPERLVKGGIEPEYALTATIPEQVMSDPLKTLMWLDINWYLPDDILVKVDRAAMSCSLETRVPMLDRRIVEFALCLPTALNVSKGVGKQVLREVLFRHVPRKLVERPKQGFAVPIAHWLRTTLREWAESLLAAERLHREGYFEVAPIRQLWQAHLAGHDDHSFQLWGVLMFQAWLDEQG